MTAAQIAKALGHTTIKINYVLSEKLGWNNYEKCPMQQLIMKVKERKEVVDKYLEGIDFEESTNYFE